MATVRVIVHETGRRWIEHVRARLRGTPIRVHHSATAQSCLEMLRHGGAAIVVFELGPEPAVTLELVERAGRLCGDRAIVVIASARQADLELPTRELGAIEFLIEPIAPREVAEFVARVAGGLHRLTSTTL